MRNQQLLNELAMDRVEGSEVAIPAAQGKQAGVAAHAETGNVEMRNKLASSEAAPDKLAREAAPGKLASTEAAPNNLTFTAEDLARAKQTVSAFRQQLLQTTRAVKVEAKKAESGAEAAQLEQVLLKEGDCLRLSRELKAAKMEKELDDFLQGVTKKLPPARLEASAEECARERHQACMQEVAKQLSSSQLEILADSPATG